MMAALSNLLLVLWIQSLWTTVAEGVLVSRTITPEDSPSAVCNDGLPGNFYHTDGAPTTRQFLIYLEGGFFCNTAEDCETRCATQPYYCSADPEPTKIVGGIFSEDATENPVFASFYKVFVHYCTSDMYIGDSVPTSENGGFYFKGRAQVEAVVNSVNSLVGFTPGDLVVVTGTSAGGRGVAFNCEYIANLIPGADVRCVVDAAIFYPYWEQNPFNENCKPFNQMIEESNEFWNGTLENFDVNTWWRTITLPTFIGELVFDDYGLMYNCVNRNVPNELQLWSEGMRNISQSLVNTASHVGLYLPGCFRHPMLTIDNWFFVVRAGLTQLTYMESLGNWLSGEGRIHAWDDCTTDPNICNTMCDVIL